MDENNILEPHIIKDLSNNIYEKRKATAFQIEGLTKNALARNDSQTIYKVINELTELTKGGNNSAKMGAITALGSVSVALGSFAIAYFLDVIVKPIFATFRDTDARVRYYACESLYNIAKIARGEILLYFNEIFDILCILVTDTESSVKNAADILDRLIKDIVSAKSTNYVSILQQQETSVTPSRQSNDIPSHVISPNGDAFQVNEVQDTQKAFSLPKFIPTLLERMYTIDPFAKKFLISWLELLDDIPSLELITFLPNFLEPLIRFLMNSAPSDVRIETQNLLKVFLKEIRTISKVKNEVKRKVMEREKNKKKKERENTEMDDSVQSTNPKEGDIEKVVDHSFTRDNGQMSPEDSSTTFIRADGKEEDNEGKYELVEEELLTSGQYVFIDFLKIIDILLSFLRLKKNQKNKSQEHKTNSILNESHEVYLEIQFTVLKWLNDLLQISPSSFVKFLPDCVTVTIQNIAFSDNNNDTELRNEFLRFNMSLQSFLGDIHETASRGKELSSQVTNLELKDSPSQDRANDAKKNENGSDNINSTDDSLKKINKEVYDEFNEFYMIPTLRAIMKECLEMSNELGKLTLLEFLIFLYSLNPQKFLKPTFEQNGQNLQETFDVSELIKSTIDASNDVTLAILQLLSKISETDETFFKKFIVKLILFYKEEIRSRNEDGNNLAGSLIPTTRRKIEFIIRKLCINLTSESIYKAFAEILSSNDNDVDFLDSMVVTLNNILLTTSELATFRKKLKNLDSSKLDDWQLFATLFLCWCFNAPSALSLCLLTSNYELAYLIIKHLSDMEVGFQLLTQLDILVQLLESPIFMKLRLQLLEPEKHPYLYKTLYGLLMILPQSSTFMTLKNRLGSVVHASNWNAQQQATSTITTPVTTPGSNSVVVNNSSISNQLSIRRKRIHEMLDKFSRVQDYQEEAGRNRLSKLNDETLTSHVLRRLLSGSSVTPSDRPKQSSPDNSEYFTTSNDKNNSNIIDKKQSKRSSSRFRLH